jgi:glucose-1-phosphate cytidylyltransferase
MKVVILAGGKGSRISEYTKTIPKPMVKIGNKNILEHIIDYYKKFGFEEFIIASGYISKIIEDSFNNKKNIMLINTGLNTLTGLRLKKIQRYLNKTFMLTYGDGLSDINLNKLLLFHKKNKKLVTLTSVHPPARFGELEIKKNLVSKFEEKPQLQKGWINGGFFVIEPQFLNYLKPTENVMLEREPLTALVKQRQLAAFSHKGFWYCMDNLRDKNVLEGLYKSKKAPWLNKYKSLSPEALVILRSH